MASEAAVWFVMVGGQQDGPLTRAELGLRSGSGTFDSESPVWKDGMDEWLPSGEVPELAALFAPAKPAAAAKPPPYKPKPASSPGVGRVAPSKPGTAKPAAKAAPKTALKPVSSATSKASSRSPERAAAPVAKKAPEKGVGMSAFDTAHFRLADLGTSDEGGESNKGFGEGANEFNTGHFRLSDLPPKEEEKTKGFGEGSAEFNTAHFRLSDLPGKKDEGPLTLDTAKQAFAPGVVGYPDAAKPAPKAVAPAKAEPASSPGKGKPPPRSVDPFPAADHQQQHEQLSDAVLGMGRGGPEAVDLAKWASSELSTNKASSPGAKAGKGKGSSPGLGKVAPSAAPAPATAAPAAAAPTPAAKASAPGKPASIRTAPAAAPDTAAIAAARARAAAAKDASEEGSMLPQLIALGIGGVVLAGGVLWLIFG